MAVLLQTPSSAGGYWLAAEQKHGLCEVRGAQLVQNRIFDGGHSCFLVRGCETCLGKDRTGPAPIANAAARNVDDHHSALSYVSRRCAGRTRRENGTRH